MLVSSTFVAAILDCLFQVVGTFGVTHRVLNSLIVKQIVGCHRRDLASALVALRRPADWRSRLGLRIWIPAAAPAQDAREHACQGRETTSTTFHFQLTSNAKVRLCENQPEPMRNTQATGMPVAGLSRLQAVHVTIPQKPPLRCRVFRRRWRNIRHSIWWPECEQIYACQLRLQIIPTIV